MRSDIAPGGTFPDYELPDHTNVPRRLSELQGDDPLILTLARGHYCPKEHQQHLELAANYPKVAVGYAQIATIKERLRLSPEQESYWPAVETALRAVARKIHATRQAAPHSTGAPIDPDSAEVQQLKSAAMPLLFQLREDQKREVRTLARLIGLEKVASLI